LNKTMMALLLILAAALALSGCSANASSNAATAAPIVTNSPMAAATMAPAASPAADAGLTGTGDVNNAAGMNGTASTGNTSGMTGTAAPMNSMTPAEAGRLAERIAEAVERISEIDDAEVVISDERVLVAVEFDDQYAAGLDERMKKMITDAVQKVDDGLTDISITDDDTLYGQVKSLGQRLAKATGFDELADDFGDLWDRVTGM